MDMNDNPRGVLPTFGSRLSVLKWGRKQLTSILFSFPRKIMVVGLLYMPAPASAIDAFKSVVLPTDIAVEIPSKWEVVSMQERKRLRDNASDIVSKAGAPPTPGQIKNTLIALNSDSTPIGAKFRTSSKTGSDWTVAMLKEATPADFEELKKNSMQMFKEVEKAGGINVIKIITLDVADLDGHPSLVMIYNRGSIGNRSDIWTVMVVSTPLQDRLVETTVSFRTNETARWLPSTQRILKSIKFQAPSERATQDLPNKK